jgi:hypothetical protein
MASESFAHVVAAGCRVYVNQLHKPCIKRLDSATELGCRAFADLLMLAFRTGRVTLRD